MKELEELVFAGQLKIMGQVDGDFVVIDFSESTFRAMKRAGAYFFILEPTWKVRPGPAKPS